MNEEAAGYLTKAEAAREDARVLVAAGRDAAALGRAYYAMFHSAQALLAIGDTRLRRHSAVHAAFGREFARTGILDPKYHRWLLDAFDARQTAEYEIGASVTAEEAAQSIDRAAEFINAARAHLQAS